MAVVNQSKTASCLKAAVLRKQSSVQLLLLTLHAVLGVCAHMHDKPNHYCC